MSEELMRVGTLDGKYVLVMRHNDQVRILRYGEDWVGPGFQGSNAFIAFAAELDELREAGRALYFAGRWNCESDVDAAALWTRFRDALGIEPGTATKLGIGQSSRETSDEVATLASEFLSMKPEHFMQRARQIPSDLFDQVKSLAASALSQASGPISREAHDRRITELLEANNREVFARREIATAARNLRAAQRAYLADRGNEELGKAVGTAAAELDRVLGDA
jgi:hypothetical protein